MLPPVHPPIHTEVAILGAGFAGLCMAIRLQQQGHQDLTIFEKAGSLGGTWRDNTYPGCGCDIPSDLYSLSFEQNPDWSRTFASQPEILGYLRQVAAKHRIEESVQFRTEIVSLRWNEHDNHWQLTVFQRTPSWVLPRNNRPTAVWQRWLKRYLPGLQWARRLALYWKAEPIALGFTLKPKAMGSSQKRALRFLQHQVDDPLLRHQLTPQYSMGCKRVLLSDDYYAALTRPNVELVTRRVTRLAPEGVVTGNGQRWPADVVIYATGFKPFNPTHQVEIVGRGGRVLADEWADGPEAFKGVAVSGYPNFFMLMGPNSGLGHNSILVMIEAQVGYICKCLRWLRRPRWRGGPLRAIEVRPEVQRHYNDWLQERFKQSVWHAQERPGLSPCTSWYRTAGGKNFTLWPSFATAYAWALRRPDPTCFFDAADLPAASQPPPLVQPPLRRAA